MTRHRKFESDVVILIQYVHARAYTHTGATVAGRRPLMETTTTTAASSGSERLLVQIASYNTALQGLHGVPQDLVDWLSPTLKVSNFLSRGRRAPDIVAVGFQELLPLHQGRMYSADFPYCSFHLSWNIQLLAFRVALSKSATLSSSLN